MDARGEIARLIDSGSLRALYQPIVRLADRQVVGYEALARGPEGTALERPDALFAAARAAGMVAELDAECRRVALLGAAEARLGPGEILSLNIEPSIAGGRPTAEMHEAALRGHHGFTIVFELTERAVTERPTQLLADVSALRASSALIALDDVGADPRSLALLPILSPELIKLDLSLLHDRPSAASAVVVHAVNAEAERQGAVVLAEGIETEAHLRRALALGAELGQGWLFGRPSPLPEPSARPRAEWTLPRRLPFAGGSTPFEIVAAAKQLRRAEKWLLLSLSHAIEDQAAQQGTAALVLSTFQEERFFTPATAARYTSLAAAAALVGALGVGLTESPAPGVRGVALEESETLRGEWNVIVLGPHFTAALAARDRGDAGPDTERSFDFALTYARELVVDAARATMGRIAATS